MTYLQTIWHDARIILPSDKEWKIVRCINKDECSDFYFMAMYFPKSGEWNFFDDDKEYERTMQVTHWHDALELEEELTFTKETEK